ncbi:MAG: dephospho-CoA kinase, partial [Pyrinomonadaceae bacterium]|nr:dephospho-CoA kinase [Pyrinomonadaceae bacterium]
LGAAVIDADLMAREVVAPLTKGWRLIVERFGSNILLPNNEIDRAKLGAIVFADAEQRQLLNNIVHPLVIESQDDWLQSRMRENPNALAIIDAALMIESGGYKRFDKLIVVWCDAETQIARLMERNNLSREAAIQRINAQMPQEEKKRYADFLIETTEGFEETRRQTIEIFEQLQLL